MLSNKESAIIFVVLTGVGALLSLLTPFLGLAMWIIGLGVATLGRVLFLLDKKIPDTNAIRITLSSWAFFCVAAIVPKILLIISKTTNLAGLYILIIATIMISLILSIEAYRTGHVNGIYLADIIFYAGNYILFATIINLLLLGGYYVLTAGNFSLDYSSTISYASIYKAGADILVIQTSCIISHGATLFLHKEYPNYFETIPIYSKSSGEQA